jgi:hypothetical protein
MGIFDLFKKLVKENKVEEVIVEKLAFLDIENWANNKIKKNEFKEKEIIFKIEVKIEKLGKEVREKIMILEDFNVNEKKEKDNIKSIVVSSRKKYIESVEELIRRLNNLKESKLKNLIDKINKLFFEFNKSSFKNYERATILIGKEMVSVRESLKVFSREILEIFNENKSIIDSFNKLLKIKEKLNTTNSINKILERISKKRADLDKKVSEKEKENIILGKNLEEIRISPSYLENLDKQKKIETLRENSKKEILELKQLLDFKALSNFFHIFEEQMNIVKIHKEDFHTNFEKDNGMAIVELLDKSRLNNDLILEKVKKIRTKKEEAENHERNLKEDETLETSSKIKVIIVEIDNLKIENVKEEKRNERFRENKKELIELLKQELSFMNVEIV